MHVSPGPYRRVCCCILFITTAMLGCLSGSSLAQQIERSYTTNDSPLVFIWNASVVSIGGSFLTFDELLEGATETDALIYPIHLDSVPTQQSNPSSASSLSPTVSPSGNARQAVASGSTVVARKQLQALADVSGGRFYHADRIEDLKDVFQHVASELRTVYSMAYTPKNLDLDGKFRRVRVQVNRPEVGIRTRPGYFGR
jgi:VWFA-related protein